MLRPPHTMISLSTLTAPTSHVFEWGLIDVGQLGPPVREGLREKQGGSSLLDYEDERTNCLK